MEKLNLAEYLEFNWYDLESGPYCWVQVKKRRIDWDDYWEIQKLLDLLKEHTVKELCDVISANHTSDSHI